MSVASRPVFVKHAGRQANALATIEANLDSPLCRSYMCCAMLAISQSTRCVSALRFEVMKNMFQLVLYASHRDRGVRIPP